MIFRLKLNHRLHLRADTYALKGHIATCADERLPFAIPFSLGLCLAVFAPAYVVAVNASGNLFQLIHAQFLHVLCLRFLIHSRVPLAFVFSVSIRGVPLVPWELTTAYSPRARLMVPSSLIP